MEPCCFFNGRIVTTTATFVVPSDLKCAYIANSLLTPNLYRSHSMLWPVTENTTLIGTDVAVMGQTSSTRGRPRFIIDKLFCQYRNRPYYDIRNSTYSYYADDTSSSDNPFYLCLMRFARGVRYIGWPKTRARVKVIRKVWCRQNVPVWRTLSSIRV